MRYSSFVLVLLLACGGGSSLVDPGPGPGPDPDPTPTPTPDPTPDPTPTPGIVASVAVVAGEAQRAEVGKELPQAVVVRTSDSQLLAVPNQLMTFVVVSGGGSVFAGTAQTNALGEARERWTLGTAAGEQILEARAVDQNTGDPIVFARITATADPGPAATMTLGETEHTMYLGERLDLAALVTGVKDQYGNDVPNQVFTASAPKPFDVQGSVVSSSSEFKDQVAVFTGQLSATLTLTVLRNLVDLVGANGSYACDGRERRSLGNDEFDVIITRLAVTFVVDSVVYGNANGKTDLWTTQTTTVTRENGTTRVFPDLLNTMVVSLQEPGMIYVEGGGGNRAGLPKSGPTFAVREKPLTYVGGPYCNSWGALPSYEPLTITK